MNLHLAQTGRTTRMLRKVIEYCDQGRAVYVFVQRAEHVGPTQKRLLQVFRDTGRTEDLYTSIKVEALPKDFDWQSMSVPRSHPNCIFLVDHSAVELRLRELDQEVMRLQQLARQLYPLTT